MPPKEMNTPKADVPRFNGHTEDDVEAWLDNYELICAACRWDPSSSFPAMTTIAVNKSLKARGASFAPNTWAALRKIIEDAFLQPANLTQLQEAIAQRRQGSEESVAQYAQAITELALKLKQPVNNFIGNFLKGLQDCIFDAGMKTMTFETFDAALRVARRVEESNASRAPRAAMPVARSLTSVVASSQQEEEPAASMRADSQRQDSSASSQYRGSRAPGRFLRGRGKRNWSEAPYAKNRSDPAKEKKRCAFCTYTGHTAMECELKLELEARRKRTGIVAVATSESLGPAMLTDAFHVGGKALQVLIDTGATASFVNARALDSMIFSNDQPAPKTRFIGGNGLPVKYAGMISALVTLHDGAPAVEHTFFVSEELPFDAIFGTDLLARANIVVDVAEQVLSLPGAIIQLSPAQDGSLHAVVAKDEELWDMTDLLDTDVDPESTPDTQDISFGEDLDPAQLDLLRALIAQHACIFKPADGFNPCTFPPFTVDTGSSPPIFQRAHRMPYVDRVEAAEMVRKYLTKGWIVPSNSAWCSPLLIVRRNGKTRLCFDVRRVNSVTVPDRYPAPHQQDCLDKLANCKYFTLCDADAAYHQCRMDPKDAHKFAFATEDGLFEPTVVIFGARNAPAHFQRHMAMTLSGIPGVFAYLDDIMVATSTFEEHVEALATVFKRMKEANIKLKPSKCRIAAADVQYLGYKVDRNGVHPDQSKIKAIVEMQPPTSVRALRTFIGMCGYYQRFIPDFAALAKPLHQLTKKDENWQWGQEQQHAFETLKVRVCSDPVLRMPDMTRPFEVLTDASTVAIGAALQQRDDDNQPYAVAFASRGLTHAESRYHTQEQECLAMIFALQKFRTYLLGRHFTLFTDHRALLSVLTKESPSPRITRWSLLMQEFDFTIVHLPGIMHAVPDALSRAEPGQVNTAPSQLALSIMTIPTETESWIHEQFRDDFCSSVFRHLALIEEQDEHELNGFRRLGSGLLVFKSDLDDRVVVPASLRESVLVHLHVDTISGHQGINRTLARVAERYFWPGWRRDTAEFVKSCQSCQQRKGQTEVHKPVLHVLSHGINDLIAMDLQGPLNETAMGHKYILVIQDIFSKFIVACPLTGATAEEISAALIQNWIGVFGCPARLLTDNGANFASSTMTDVIMLLKIQKLWTSPYRPQTDGSVERINRTLVGMMSHYLNGMQDNWDSFIALLALAYNSTFNSTIGTSPYRIFMSREPPGLADWLMHIPPGTDSRGGEEVKRALKATLTAAYQHRIAQKNREQQNQQDLQAEWNEQFAVGEQVLLLDLTTPVGMKPKYRRRWTGPFKIKEVTGPLSYTVESLNGLKEYRAHREHLKRVYLAPGMESSPQAWPTTEGPHQITRTRYRHAGVSLGTSSPAHDAAKSQTASRKSRKSRKSQSEAHQGIFLEGEDVASHMTHGPE